LDFTAGSERYDLVFDAHAGVSYGRAARVLAPGGAYARTLPTPGLMVRGLVSSLLPMVGRGFVANMRGEPSDYAELERLLASGEVKPIIAHVLPLSAAAEGFALAEAGGVVGKVVLQIR
jgi:NADPH:quinone reductase-like Zn-dependent oxidoreductase